MVAKPRPRRGLGVVSEIACCIVCGGVTLFTACAHGPAPGGARRELGAWSAPEPLRAINGPDDELRPTLSPDGLALYFGSNRPGGMGGRREGTDLYVARRTSPAEGFGAPTRLRALSSDGDDNAPSFSADGRRIVFGSDRPGGCGGTDLWAAERDDPASDEGWSLPRNLGCVVNAAEDDDGPSLLDGADGGELLLFTSQRPGGPGDWDLWETERGPGQPYAPPRLVAALSSPARDTRTALRRDGLELFLTTSRPGGLGGTDLWRSTRATLHDAWAAPTPLGAPINSAAADGAPTLSSDGTMLVFDSARPGGAGKRDLYVSRRTR